MKNSLGVVGAIILGGLVAYGAVIGLIWLDIRDAHKKLEKARAPRERPAILFGDAAAIGRADREDQR